MKIKAPRPTLSSFPSASPAPVPGADTQKAVQQLLQNAFQPAPQAGPPPSTKKKKHTEESFRPASTAGADAMKAVQQHLQNAFQPAPQAAPPPSTKKKKKHTEESFQPAPSHGANTMKAVQQLLQHAYQPAPPPKPKVPEKSAFASFASKLKTTRNLDQTPFQPTPEPAPQPKPKAPKHKPAQSAFQPALTALKLAQTAFQPAPAPSSGGWSPVSINRNGTFTLPTIGTFPLPAAGEMKKIDLQDGKFFKIRHRTGGAYGGKFGPDALPAQPEEGKKDADGWAQLKVDPDGMIRVPGVAQPLYRPKPGQTDSVTVDAKTTFRLRQGEDGHVYGTFETQAPSQPPPGWQRVNVDADGMVRLPNFAPLLYPPQPGQTETVHLDKKTTFIMRRAEDGEVHGTFETKAPMEPPPGWTRVNVDADGMIRLPGHAQAFYPPQPGKTNTLQLDDKTTFILSHTADGEVNGTFETKAPPEQAPVDQPGLDVDDSKREYEGVVTTRMKDGQKVVDVGALGTLVAPAVGGHDSYLMDLDKLLVLFGKPDGTVEVSTRKLGIENKSDGFKGALLPSEGTLTFAGHVFDVSKLQPGEHISKEMHIDGTKFKVKVRMNHDGSVTVIGTQKKSLFQKMLGWAGTFLPFLAAIPGLGVLALVGKVVAVFNAVKNLAQSFKNGNLLGIVGSAASVAVNFSQGAFQAFASKVANLANVGQQVVATLAHGMGKGLLQVVSNGAKLVSGIAQAAADLGQGGFQSRAHNVAQLASDVGGYAGGVDSALKGDLTPLATQVAGDVVQEVKKNNSPQAQSPVANPTGEVIEYAFLDHPLTAFDSPATDDPPPLDKDPNDLGPDGKDLTGLFPGDDPKDPIYKNLYLDNGKGPKDWTGLPGRVSDTEDSVLVAGLPGFLVSMPPDQLSIRQRVLGFLKGFVKEGIKQGTGVLATAKMFLDMRPLNFATELMVDVVLAPIFKKDPGALVWQRAQGFIGNYKSVADQVIQLASTVSKIVGPERALNELQMYRGIFEDMRAQTQPLTAQTVLQIIRNRTRMNPSYDEGLKVLDAFTNYQRILETGDPQAVGEGAMRVFLALAPFSKSRAQQFGKLRNTPGDKVDNWGDPNFNHGTGVHGEAVRGGVRCSGFVCAWAEKAPPVAKYTGTPRVPTSVLNARQVEAWLREKNLLLPDRPPRNFANSTDAIEFLQRNDGRYIVFKPGSGPGKGGHAFAVEVRNGRMTTRDPSGGAADALWSHPALGKETRVVPLVD